MSEGHEPQGFLRKYVFSFDHKVIGIQYLVLAMLMSVVAIGLSVVMRIQLAWPQHADASFHATGPLEHAHSPISNEVELGRRGTGVVERGASGEAPVVPIDPERIGCFRHRKWLP